MTLGQKNRSSSLSLQSVLMDKQQKKPPVSGTRKAKRDWLRFKTQKTDKLWVIKFSDCRDVSIWGNGKFTGMHHVSLTKLFLQKANSPRGKKKQLRNIHTAVASDYIWNGIKWCYTNISFFSIYELHPEQVTKEYKCT